MNDLIRSDSNSLVPTGFNATDPHGFTTGQTAQIVLRDASGLALTSYTLQPTTGGTMGDIVTQLSGSPLGNFGAFSLDSRGRIRFDPVGGLSGATLSMASDSTDRFGSGRTFSALSGLSGLNSGLATRSSTAPARCRWAGSTPALPSAPRHSVRGIPAARRPLSRSSAARWISARTAWSASGVSRLSCSAGPAWKPARRRAATTTPTPASPTR